MSESEHISKVIGTIVCMVLALVIGFYDFWLIRLRDKVLKYLNKRGLK